MTTEPVEFPRRTLLSLKREATRLAKHNGHYTLGPWRFLADSPDATYIRECRLCGMPVMIRTRALDYERLCRHTKAKGITVLHEPASEFRTHEHHFDGLAYFEQCPGN